MRKINGFTIIEVIKVVYENTLLELYFNIRQSKEEMSFCLFISEDGETIHFSQSDGMKSVSDIASEIYTVMKITDNVDELAILINSEITDVQFGIGQTLDKRDNVLYYFKISTSTNNFLFFNDGDKGAYSFDNIEEILAKDIYGYKWVKDW